MKQMHPESRHVPGTLYAGRGCVSPSKAAVSAIIPETIHAQVAAQPVQERPDVGLCQSRAGSVASRGYEFRRRFFERARFHPTEAKGTLS